MLRYKLRTLLILAALLPAVVGGVIASYLALDRWVKSEYTRILRAERDRQNSGATKP